MGYIPRLIDGKSLDQGKGHRCKADRRTGKLRALTAAVLLGILPMIASAQYSQNPDADYIQINVKGWLFCPVTDQSRVQGNCGWIP